MLWKSFHIAGENVVFMQISSRWVQAVCPWVREVERQMRSEPRPADISYLDVFMYANFHLFATIFLFLLLQKCFYADLLYGPKHVRYE